MSCIIVTQDQLPAEPLIDRLVHTLEQEATDFDFVLLANGVPSDATLSIKAFVESTPDTTAVFLSQLVGNDVARLVGIDHAIGDYVLFIDPTAAEIDAVPALLSSLKHGYDLVIGDARSWIVERSPLSNLLFDAYIKIYRNATGVELERDPTGPRIFTRAAALYVSSRTDGEVLLRARNIGAGFPAAVVPVPAPETIRHRAQPMHQSWSKGLRLLLGVSAFPLRSATYIAAAGGFLSVLYAMYVVGVLLLKPNVQAGWTTISLQVAGMMFIFSIVFIFLSEYIIQIHAANPPRNRRHLVLREFRSTLSRRSMRLNVVDSRGEFQVGAQPFVLGRGQDREGR